MNQDRKPLVVLERLLQGGEVLFQNRYRVVLDEENMPCMIGTTGEDATDEVLLPFDMHLSYFIKACLDMPDEKIAIHAANNTLNRGKDA